MSFFWMTVILASASLLRLVGGWMSSKLCGLERRPGCRDLGREPPKSKDEAVADEVEKLSKQVDQTLKLADNQHKWLEDHVEKKASTKLSPDPPQPTKELSAEPDMGNVTDKGESRAKSPADIKQDATPKVPTDEHSGNLAHVFPHMSKKSSL